MLTALKDSFGSLAQRPYSSFFTGLAILIGSAVLCIQLHLLESLEHRSQALEEELGTRTARLSSAKKVFPGQEAFSLHHLQVLKSSFPQHLFCATKKEMVFLPALNQAVAILQVSESSPAFPFNRITHGRHLDPNDLMQHAPLVLIPENISRLAGMTVGKTNFN